MHGNTHSSRHYLCDHLFCCHSHASRLVLSISDHLGANGILILTLKSVDRLQARAINRECSALLSSWYSDIHITWLFANKNERTLIARRNTTPVDHAAIVAMTEANNVKEAERIAARDASAPQRKADKRTRKKLRAKLSRAATTPTTTAADATPAVADTPS